MGVRHIGHGTFCVHFGTPHLGPASLVHTRYPIYPRYAIYVPNIPDRMGFLAKYVQCVNLVHLGSTRFQPVWCTHKTNHTHQRHTMCTLGAPCLSDKLYSPDTPCVHKTHQIGHLRRVQFGVPTWYTWVQPVWYKHTNTPVVQHWLMITTHTDNTVWSPPFKTLLTRRCEGGEGRRWGCQGD